MIIRRRCDKQMAEKKGFLNTCDKQHCKTCPCCIETDDEGLDSHVVISTKLRSLYIPWPIRKRARLADYGMSEGYRFYGSISDRY